MGYSFYFIYLFNIYYRLFTSAFYSHPCDYNMFCQRDSKTVYNLSYCKSGL